MPGSPPSNTTDPGTIPPPRTRSISLKPLVNLDIFFDEILLKELLKKYKVFCGTGGTLIDSNIQLQGDMVSKSIEFLRKEGFHNL